MYLKRVLIVEDEGTVCQLLNILLNDHGMILDHIQNLADAAEYIETEKPALVILDNKLPDGFGVDFIPYLKSKYPDIGVIVMSGFGVSVKDAAVKNGADIFLEKPFSKDALFKAVNHLA